MIQLFKHLIPSFHAFTDEERRYNIGATWTDQDGLQDFHNLEFKYVRNSERLALGGEPQPDGSWRYEAPDGSVHTISAERAQAFMDQTHRQATMMCAMLDKLQNAGTAAPTVDTSASPA
jgi:hypothetical protein